MNRKDTLFFVVMLTVALLLTANLFKPTALHAYESGDAAASVPVSIAATEDSAWVVVGNTVYYVSLKQRSQFPSGQRTINVIDSQTIE